MTSMNGWNKSGIINMTNTSESSHFFAHEKAAVDIIKNYNEKHKIGELFTNLELHDKQSNRYFEIDLIVIACFGIYVVELKFWSGHIEIRPNTWLQNRSFYKEDPHKANNFKSKLLKGLYERKFPYFPSVYFESVVVLTNVEATVIGGTSPQSQIHNPTFAGIDRFLEYIQHQSKSKPHNLNVEQRQEFSHYLRTIVASAVPRDFVFPGYEIVERLYQYTDRAEVTARRADVRHRRLSRLRIFFPPTGVNQHEARERATSTLSAVAKIGDHPHILKVWDIPNENNFIVEGSDWSETGTLRNVIERDGAMRADRAIHMAVGILYGLDAAHEHCIVHRNLSPENILVVNEIPKLMNFDLSYQLEDNRVTVIPDTAKLKRTPYIAPEIYRGGETPEATADLFSLGVILYELVTGERPFKCSTDLERSEGMLPNVARQRLQDREAPSHIVELLFDLIQQDPRKRPAEAKQVLNRLKEKGTIAADCQMGNPRLNSGVQHGLYRIQEFIREGAESQLYRAVGARGRPIALKLFNYDVDLQRVVNEQLFAAAIHHPSLIRVDGYSQWDDGRYYIAFEWVSEKSLRDEIDEGKRPDCERFVRYASQLLKALDALHLYSEEGVQRPILHNDIKPENILIGEGDRPILVDFGASSNKGVRIYEGTEGYVAPDLRVGSDRRYCEDGDLYALAVTLHEWLTGSRPDSAANTHPDAPAEILNWLRQGGEKEAARRFNSGAEMRAALPSKFKAEKSSSNSTRTETDSSAAIPVTPLDLQTTKIPQFSCSERFNSNPFVAYLNSLHNRQAKAENALAESQACNPFFGTIHVSHPIVTIIRNRLLDSLKRHVILTGHAGDGKSTIAIELFKQFTDKPNDEPLQQPLARQEDVTFAGKMISFVKDFSEWSPRERANLMTELLDPDGPRYLLISNSGTLLDTFKEYEQKMDGDWKRIESNLLEAMNDSIPNDPFSFHGASFFVINVARIDNLGIAEQIFQRMLEPNRWEMCESNRCHFSCPIYRNVLLLQQNLSVIQRRLFLAYRRIFEYGNRLTIRRLCAHMAYMITSGLDCQDAWQISQAVAPPRMADFLFFNRFFGDNGRDIDEPALQLRAIRIVREQEFGSQLCPSWERKFWFRSRESEFLLNANQPFDDFEFLRKCGAKLKFDDSMTDAQAREQVRRAVFFLHQFEPNDENVFLKTFLKSIMILDFSRWQTRKEETLDWTEKNLLFSPILHVLQENFTGVQLPEGNPNLFNKLYITLSRKTVDVRQSAQVVLAHFSKDDFSIRLHTSKNGAGGIRRELVFEHVDAHKLSLPLALPFLDYIMMRNQGDIGRGLQASYADRLERFKSQLIAHHRRRSSGEIMLVQLRTNHTFRQQRLAIQQGRLEVTDGY